MPANTSASGDYLAPINAAPTEDDDLDAQLQPVIVGITGLSGTLVRPRWQEVPPTQPARTVNWCAFGVTNETADTNPTIIHDGADNGGLGTSTQYRAEFFDVLASFYGPNCKAYASLLRDGLNIGQNREAMRANGIAFVATDRITPVPEFTNEEWIRRVDVAFSIRRMVARTYAIENIVELVGQVVADGGSNTGQRTVTSPIDQGL